MRAVLPSLDLGCVLAPGLRQVLCRRGSSFLWLPLER